MQTFLNLQNGPCSKELLVKIQLGNTMKQASSPLPQHPRKRWLTHGSYDCWQLRGNQPLETVARLM